MEDRGGKIVHKNILILYIILLHYYFCVW